jgi:uncharacterized protein YheU (UPF0270 family)
MTDVIEIPFQQLSAETLQAVLEEFINREGTDYGEIEYRLEEKVTQLHRLLVAGHAAIVFDPLTESCTLIDKRC